MTAPFSCAQMDDLAAELAAGIVPAEMRNVAEAHVAGCARCRALVAELTTAVDQLLLLAPGDEPGPGFDARVLERIGARPRRPAVVAAAAVIALVLLAGGLVLGRAMTSHPGGIVASAPLRAGNGLAVGRAYLHAGSSPWVLVDVRGLDHAGAYTVVLVLPDGRQVPDGQVDVAGGQGTTGVRLPAGTATVKAVRLTMRSADRDEWYQCEAIF